MPKTKISEFSATPGNNTDIDGINIAEGCAPSGINDAIRELMAQLKDFQAGTAGDSFNGPVGTSTAAAGAFTTLTTSSTVTHNGGTANGVAYLNGSKVLTTGSALTFNGTQLGVTNGAGSAIFKLDGTSAPEIDFYASGAIKSYIYAPSTSLQLNTVGSNPIIFLPNEVEGMRLTSTGLGIGTSSPNSKLQVQGLIRTSSAASGVQIDRRDTSVSAYTLYSSAGNLQFYNGTSDVMVLDTSGNLGLGVTPSAFSGGKAIEIGAAGNAFNGYEASNILISSGAYYNGGWKYANSSYGASLYQQYRGTHNWQIAASGTAGNAISFTQAMTLDASGRLLVNTTAANITNSEKLTVNGIATIYTGSATVPTLHVQNTDTTASTNQPYIGLHDGVSLRGALGVNYTDSATIINGQGGIRFRYGSTGMGSSEAARITSGGDLLVGKTATGLATGIQLESGGGSSFIRSSSSNADLNLYVYSTGAAAARFYVGMGGTVYATSTTITAISDQRLKENIQDIDVGLDKIMALKPRKFDWKAGKGKDIKGDRGWIAQEFEQVFPEMVDTWKDPAPEGEEPYKAVNADLIPVLVKAIQEQQAIITDLRARVAALETK